MLSTVMSNIFISARDSQLLDSLKELLDRAGFTTTTFNQSKSMLEELSKCRPKCIVAEALADKHETIEMVRAIKEKIPTVPVILVTSQAELSHAMDAIRAGAFDFLETPIVDRLLIESLEHAIAS
ncbi:MAG: response regulator [Pseudomonadales bacterium]|nr:response regulator [Pseudomonadales bacterium]